MDYFYELLDEVEQYEPQQYEHDEVDTPVEELCFH